MRIKVLRVKRFEGSKPDLPEEKNTQLTRNGLNTGFLVRVPFRTLNLVLTYVTQYHGNSGRHKYKLTVEGERSTSTH